MPTTTFWLIHVASAAIGLVAFVLFKLFMGKRLAQPRAGCPPRRSARAALGGSGNRVTKRSASARSPSILSAPSASSAASGTPP